MPEINWPPATKKKDEAFEERQEHLNSIEAVKQKKIDEQVKGDIKENQYEMNVGRISRVQYEEGVMDELKDSLKETMTQDSVDTTKKPFISQEVEEKPEKNKRFIQKVLNWLKGGSKKAAIVTAFTVGGVTALASTTEKNPADSLGKKQGIEKVSASKEKVNDQVKGDWNDFLGWMKGKGMQGKPELDHNNLGYQLLDQYIAEHPGTSLSREILKSINMGYTKLREDRLQQIREGKLILDKGVTEDNFMKWVVENNKTEHPEYPGSNFTRQEFPEDFELVIDMGTMDHNAIAHASMTEKGVMGKMNDMTMADQKVKKVSKGFAKIGPGYSNETNTASFPGTDIAKGNK